MFLHLVDRSSCSGLTLVIFLILWKLGIVQTLMSDQESSERTYVSVEPNDLSIYPDIHLSIDAPSCRFTKYVFNNVLMYL